MKYFKLDDCEYELLREVFNYAISYVRRRNLTKTEKDYRDLLAQLLIQAKRQENG